MHIRATVLVVYAEEGNNDGNNGDSGNEEKRGERAGAHLHDIIQQEREKRGRRREGGEEREKGRGDWKVSLIRAP